MTLCEAVTRPIKQDGAGLVGGEASLVSLSLGGDGQCDIADGDVVECGRIVVVE